MLGCWCCCGMLDSLEVLDLGGNSNEDVDQVRREVFALLLLLLLLNAGFVMLELEMLG